MKSRPITDQTRAAILDAAWALARSGRVDFGWADLAAAAGVSRQTLWLAFGSRAALLLEMVRHHDRTRPELAELIGLARIGADGPALRDFARVWLGYLPEVQPVAVQLEAGAGAGDEARAAWENRMVNGLLTGLRAIAGRAAAAGHLGGQDPEELAVTIWGLIAPSAWALHVDRLGWAPARFVANRLRLIDGLLGLDGGGGGA